MKKASKLQECFEAHGGDVETKGLLFIKAMQDFSLVVGSCFGVNLLDDFGEKIDQFKMSYLKLNISISPKV